MVREGAPSTACSASNKKDVDGRPSPAMTISVTRRATLTGLLAAPMIRTARAAEPVTYLFPAPSFLPAFVPHRLAEKRGYYTANGLDVTFQTGRGGADVAKQVGVGNADLGGGVGETSMIVRANGLPVRGVALLGGKSLCQIVTRKAANIKALTDLRGKKIGVIAYQDTSFYALLGVLASVGIHRTDLEIQAVGPAGMTQLMISGSLDGIMAVPEWSVAIETAGTPLDYFPIDKVMPSMAQAILSSDATIKKRPQMVHGFVTAVLRALSEAMQDPAAAARDFAAQVPQQQGKEVELEVIIRRYATQVWPTTPPSDLGRFDPQRLLMLQKSYIANEVIQTAVPIEELYTNEFVS
jgi:NitT/TauT family transport system substrate-binding protein